MKKTLLFLTIICSVFLVRAQSTAMDWTRNDCDNSTTHHLFDELDSGYVVQIDFDMIPACATCNASVHTLKPMLTGKMGEYPNRLRYYCVGYINSYSCTQMVNWKTAQNVDGLVFTNGASEVAYYGGMGMPTIVVLGGGIQHKVYYKKIGFATGDTSTIAAAIDSAMAESQQTTAITDIKNSESLNIFPNPANNQLNIAFVNQNKPDFIIITNPTGQKIVAAPFTPAIDISSLPLGIYFVTLRLSDGNLVSRKFLKQ